MEKLLNIFNEDEFLKENKLIFKKYKPLKKLGFGSFGNVYSVIRKKDKLKFAMKVEKKNQINKMLETEAYYLYILREGFGIPKIISFGYYKKYNILIETLLDKNLYTIFKENSLKILDICLIVLKFYKN